jgi:hypothetical protein
MKYYLNYGMADPHSNFYAETQIWIRISIFNIELGGAFNIWPNAMPLRSWGQAITEVSAIGATSDPFRLNNISIKYYVANWVSYLMDFSRYCGLIYQARVCFGTRTQVDIIK